METYIKCLEVVQAWMDRLGDGRFYVRQRHFTTCHTSRRSQSELLEDFCDQIPPNIWLSNSIDSNPLDYYVKGVVEWEIKKTLCNIKDELKGKITAAFSNLHGQRRNGLWEIPRTSGSCSWGQINSIYNILGYFYAILVNISNKVICKCYFNFSVILWTIYPSHSIYIYICVCVCVCVCV